MKTRTKIILLSVVSVFALGLGGCASCDRWTKSVGSNISGGLDRTVTLYSNTGEVVKTWEGTIDLKESDEEILFDLDGKRIVIQGGIVVVEER